MKFVCDKNTILNEIITAQDIVSTKNALSILSNVLLSTENNTLTIRATDRKVGFQTQVPVQTVTTGSTTVFCDKFLNILRSCPDGEIEFEEVENNRLHIKPAFKKIDFKLKSIASEKYPEMTIVDDDSYFTLPQADFLEMITQTIFSVSDDQTRYFMNGVFLDCIGEKIIMVATDGRRLSYCSRNTPDDFSEFNGIIIPPKILQLIKKMALGEGEIKIAVADKNIFIKIGNYRFFSNLIEGQFPNYSKVIPESQDYNAVIDRLELIEAVKRVSLFVESKAKRIYVKIENNAFELQSEENEIGTANEELPCEYTGESIRVALNYQYLLDPLRDITDDKVVLKFTESNKALSLHPLPEKDFFHIIMPMQIN